MIPVTLAQEPASFDAKVRQPGLSAIDEMLGKPPRLKRPGRKRQPLKGQNGQQAPAEEISRITATLPILNHRLRVQERMEYLRCYQLGPHNGGIDLAYLESRAPFIAQELRRQGRMIRKDAGLHGDSRNKQQ